MFPGIETRAVARWILIVKTRGQNYIRTMNSIACRWKPLFAAILLPALSLCAQSDPQKDPDLAWWRESMKTRDQRMRWFREARFGCFIHWGVYSELGGVWRGQPVSGYAEHIMRVKQIPMKVYREDVAGEFNPKAFNAEEWVTAIRRAGMRYLIITAKHHDGFAMWPTKVNDYDIVDATPFKRDPMRELKAACDRHGIKFGFYYSHAQDWGDTNGTRNFWEFGHPPERPWWNDPKWADHEGKVHEYYTRKCVPQVIELCKEYQPAILWFDTSSWAPQWENNRALKAVRDTKPDVIVSSRVGGNMGDYISTTDKPAEFPPENGDWEAIPTTNESYGWHKRDNTHKPPEHFIELLIKSAARGGNLLLNIGPMGNGRFDPKDAAILQGIGDWMEVHSESIYGTTRTPLPVQAWGESTRKGDTLYVHVLTVPSDRKLVVGGLKSNVKRALLLRGRYKTPVDFARLNDLDVVLTFSERVPLTWGSVIELEMEGELITNPTRLLATNVPMNRLHVFDGRLEGKSLRYGNGKRDEDLVGSWTDPNAAVRWPVRLNGPATFDVALAHNTTNVNSGGTVMIQIGNQTLKTAAKTGKENLPLGRVTLQRGAFDVVVKAEKIEGAELMRPRAVLLTPVSTP